MEHIVKIVQKPNSDKPTFDFKELEDKKAFMLDLASRINKNVKVVITTYNLRSNKQNSLYWRAIEYFGNEVFDKMPLELRKNKAHEYFITQYSMNVLEQTRVINEVMINDKLYVYTFSPFSIAFRNLDNVEATKYYNWVFDLILEHKNQNRNEADKLNDIKDYISECKEGVKI